MEWALISGIAGLVIAVVFFVMALVFKVKFGGSLIFLILLAGASAFMIARSTGVL